MHMEEDLKEVGQRLRAARKKAGFKTAKAAAESLGIPYPTYTQHENGTRGLQREADVYVRRFKVTLDWLLGGKGPGPEISAEDNTPTSTTKPNASFPPRYQRFSGDATLPLLGQTVAGPNGRFVLNGSEAGRVFTPPMLEGVEGAYAVRVYGTSMEPRYYAGETVWLNPHEPVRQGDDVVVQVVTDEENGRESYIKRFVSRSSTVTRLWQHNPDEDEKNELTFDTEKVFSIHKIVFHATV